jgi:hypothetical protein
VDLGSEGVGQGAAPKNAMDPREGNKFCGGSKAYGLDFGFEGEGQGVVGLGLH